MENMEILNGILNNIREGTNTLIWKKNTLPFFDRINEKYRYSVYINEMAPIKTKIIDIIIKVSQLKNRKNIKTKSELNKNTVVQLKEILKKTIQKDKLVIVFNRFENITKSVAQFWLSVSGNKFIVFVGSIWGIYKKEAHGFHKTFILVNKEEKENYGTEMNVTIPFIFVIGAFIFVILFKLGLTTSRTFMSALIMAILIVRSLMFFIDK